MTAITNEINSFLSSLINKGLCKNVEEAQQQVTKEMSSISKFHKELRQESIEALEEYKKGNTITLDKDYIEKLGEEIKQDLISKQQANL